MAEANAAAPAEAGARRNLRHRVDDQGRNVRQRVEDLDPNGRS